VGTIITSFDVWQHSLPCIEIHGTHASLSAPNPNTFGGPVKVRFSHDSEGGWKDVPLTHSYCDPWRSLGVADMAYALRTGRPARASGALAYHVLDLMHAFHDASDAGKHIEMQSTCERPEALPTGLREGELES
jgi:predicted dehydrogenase